MDISDTHIPQRVVSIVPSLTESLFDLGLGTSVIGITDYCVHPADKLAGIRRIGGTKTPRVKDILALRPDLVIANREENPKDEIEALISAGLKVWITFPKTVRQAMNVLWELTGIYKNNSAAARLKTIEVILDWAELSAREQSSWTYFCPIWINNASPADTSDWWMTFNGDTYPSDLLGLFGGVNVFSSRQRRYPIEADLGLVNAEDPAGRDIRYPCVTAGEIQESRPDCIILPSEPYFFGNQELDELTKLFPDLPAIKQGKIYPIDGSLITWHGTRLARALNELPSLLGL